MEERSDGPSWAFTIVLIGYLAIASLYALKTPHWQAPDEPAHFNYIVALAETGKVPVLRSGDYPAEYLETIKTEKFPAEMSIAPIRYEYYQPPLYYAIGALVYKATARWAEDGQILALRLLSVMFGALGIAVAYQIVRVVFPNDSMLATATAAFVGLLPMHTAMTAAINPDALAELAIALALLLLLRPVKRDLRLRKWLTTGLVLGLGLLTKITVVVAVLAVPVALWLESRERRLSLIPHPAPRQGKRRAWGTFIGGLTVIWGTAGFVFMPWVVRNEIVYGAGDPLGWNRHNAVVVGQPRTSEWLAQLGFQEYARRFVLTTFHSFWGQFGWMGAPMDARVYDLVFGVSLLAALGFVLYLWDIVRHRPGDRPARLTRGLITLGFTLVLTVGIYLAYNMTYVQHQGRYFFPSIVPIALFFSLGLRDIISPHRWALLAGLWIASLFLLNWYSLFHVILPQLR
jgi:hypothetical protein